MILLPPYNVIYLAQPCTASTTIAWALKTQLGGIQLYGHHEYSDHVLERHWRIVSGVRDHRTALVSLFRRRNHRRKEEPNDLYEWLMWYMRYGPWVRHNRLYWRYLPMTTHSYRYETLDADLHRLCDQLDMPRLKLEDIRMQSSEGTFPVRHTPDTQALVERVFGTEMMELGYL